MSLEQLSKLTERDLLFEKKLQDISKRSIPSKEEEGQPSSAISNTVVSDLNLRDLGIEEQLEKISRNTIKQVWGWKPTTIKSDVTQEMIQEYQDELERSSYEDPITGRKFKYVPVNSDFTLEEPDLKRVIATDEVIFDDLRQLAQQYTATEKDLVTAYDAIQFIRNSETISGRDRKKLLGPFAEFEELPEIKRLQGIVEQLKQRLIDIQGAIDQVQEIRKTNKQNILDNEAEIDRVRKSNAILLKQKSDELNLLNRGKMNLQQQPNESDEDFKQRLLDVGQVEFDETYVEEAAGRRALARFKENMKSITRNNTLVEQIIKSVPPFRLFEYNKFFSLLLKKFEEIYGKAKLTEDNALEIVDFFDNVLAKETLVGSNVPAFRGLRQASISRQSSEGSTISDIFAPLESAEYARTKLGAVARQRRKGFEDDLQSRAVSEPKALGGFGPVTAAQQEAEATIRLLQGLPKADPFSDLGLPALPVKAVPATSAELPIAEFPELGLGPSVSSAAESIGTSAAEVEFNPYQMTVSQLLQTYAATYNQGAARGKLLTSGTGQTKAIDFNGNPIVDEDGKQVFYPPTPHATRYDILQRLRTKGIIGTEDSYKKSPVKKKSGRPIGSGFLEDLPKYAAFGKIAINPKALYYDNNLVVMHHNKHHINGYRNVKVSDHFVNAIMKLLNQEVPKHEDLKHFDLKEKELYDMVIHLAGLHKRVEHNLDRTKQAMKHRFELLDGEINAGNNNDDIKKEIKALVHKMAYAGMITHHAAHQYLYPAMRSSKKAPIKKAPKSKK